MEPECTCRLGQMEAAQETNNMHGKYTRYAPFFSLHTQILTWIIHCCGANCTVLIKFLNSIEGLSKSSKFSISQKLKLEGILFLHNIFMIIRRFDSYDPLSRQVSANNSPKYSNRVSEASLKMNWSSQDNGVTYSSRHGDNG